MTENTARAIRFRYTNWQGKTAMRFATPKRVMFTATKYHPDKCWIMRAFCHDKGEIRNFALGDCVFISDAKATK
jgi:predicted DNA-binding transcriptional regulator YafY